MANSRTNIMFTVLLFPLLVQQMMSSAQTLPSIDVNEDSMSFTASRLLFRRIGAKNASFVVTQDSLDQQFYQRDLSSASDSLQTQEDLNELREANRSLTEKLMKSEERYDALKQSYDNLVEEVRGLALALDARLPYSNITCSSRSTLQGGSVSGHLNHMSIGAVRTLKCDPGLTLVDSAPTVICGEDGDWSDSGKARCVPRPTDSPTPAPTDFPFEKVTCCAFADNWMYDVYIDGDKVHVAGSNPRGMISWSNGLVRNSPAQFSFPSNSTTLGIFSADGEGGCEHGFLSLACSTPSGKGPWNMFTPGKGGSLGHLKGDRRWSIYTAKKSRSGLYEQGMINGDFPAWTGRSFDNFLRPTTEDVAAQGNFSKKDFDASGNGFVFPQSTTIGSVTQVTQKINSTVGCPRVYDGPYSGICGGTTTPQQYTVPGPDRTVAFWWSRFDATGNP